MKQSSFEMDFTANVHPNTAQLITRDVQLVSTIVFL